LFQSIRWRIAVPYILLLLLTLLGLATYVASTVRQSYINQMQTEITADARLIAVRAAAALQDGAPPDELDRIARQSAAILNRRVTIIDAEGNVLAESHEAAAGMENHMERPEFLQAWTDGEGISLRDSETLGSEMLYAAVAVYPPGEESAGTPLGYVRVALPLQQIQQFINRMLRIFLGLTLAAALISTLIAAWIASRTTRSLRRLTEAVRQVPAGELFDEPVSRNSDEFGQLHLAFNQMAVRLRKQINDLDTERSKLAAVLAQMTDGVIIAGEEGEVQLINPAAENMFSITQESALGRTLAEALRSHQFVDLWQQCKQSGETVSTSIEIPTRRIFLQAVATPLGESLPGSILLLFQDLTRLRHLETVRRDFISNISHELRTPLASLKALTETLQESAFDDPPAARRFLQRMETEVDALSLMVSELLELSRIESGRVPLQLKAVDPKQVIQVAVDRMKLQAQRAGLEMVVDCPSGTPSILADQPRLEQVMVNLLHNAIKFTPAGGRISIHLESSGSEALFTVQDTGPGITEDDLPRIFERFYKADRARTSGGTGLGLAIARHLVEAHGGRIWAESQVGRGSTFRFSIPLAS